MDPDTPELWTTTFGKEWGNLAQGVVKTGTEGTDSIFVTTHGKIKKIPRDRVITYAQIVV